VLFAAVLALCAAGWGQQRPPLRLMEDDILQLNVPQAPELTLQMTVRSDGTISIPHVGAVRVAGLTLSEAEEALREPLKRYLKNPQFSLEIVQKAPRLVYVTGEVMQPGAYFWEQALTAVEALTVAGGPTPRADLSAVALVRDGQEVAKIDLYDKLVSGKQGAPVPLLPRDQLVVPRKPRVFVAGAVAQPGEYDFERRQTVTQALALAGGPLADAELRRVRLLRGTEEHVLNLEEAYRGTEFRSDIELADGDRIFVPARGKVWVLGQVAKPGSYDVMLARTLAQALSAAGGPAQGADLARVYIVREQEALVVDATGLLSGASWEANVRLEGGDVVLVPLARVVVLGEVTAPGEYPIRSGTRVADALALARGTREEADLSRVLLIRGRTERELNLSSLITGAGGADNVVLQSDDIIVVPRGLVYVAGEVTRPGAYPYMTARTARQAIVQAGGFAETADKEEVRVIRFDAQRAEHQVAAEGAAALDAPLRSGDTVLVPRRQGKDIYVLGEVARPGLIRYEEAQTVLQAISMAGGVDPETADLLNTRIVRRGRSVKVNLGALLRGQGKERDVALEPGDMVIVPQVTTGFVYVVGEVVKPGAYVYRPDLTLSQALGMAGGLTDDGAYSHIEITRREPGRAEPLVINFDDYIKTGDPAKDIPLRQGDIVRVFERKGVKTRRRVRDFSVLGSFWWFLKGLF